MAPAPVGGDARAGVSSAVPTIFAHHPLPPTPTSTPILPALALSISRSRRRSAAAMRRSSDDASSARASTNAATLASSPSGPGARLRGRGGCWRWVAAPQGPARRAHRRILRVSPPTHPDPRAPGSASAATAAPTPLATLPSIGTESPGWWSPAPAAGKLCAAHPAAHTSRQDSAAGRGEARPPPVKSPAMESEPSAPAPDGAASPSPAAPLDLPILQAVRAAQAQHGLRHGDFKRYRWAWEMGRGGVWAGPDALAAAARDRRRRTPRCRRQVVLHQEAAPPVSQPEAVPRPGPVRQARPGGGRRG